MRKRRLLIPVLLLTLALALAQDVPAQLNLDVRLSIVESRLSRLESDVAGLARVPEQLARMETTLQALAEKTNGNSGTFQALAMTVVTSVISGVIAYTIGKRSK